MSSGFTGETFLTYSLPRPFNTPTEEVRRDVRFSPPFDDIVSREFIEFSSQYIEEIMLEITIEYGIRNLTPPTWRAYPNENDSDGITFTPQRDGRTLAEFPTKFYPLYVRDIQSAIDVLVGGDTQRPDSRGRHLANVFANNQGNPRQKVWTQQTKLKDNIKVPDALSADSVKSINPLSRALAGEWPFLPEDIAGIAMRIGVTMDGRVQHDMAIDDPNYPQFSIGMPSGFVAGAVRDPDIPQDGRDVPMTPAGRPTRDARVTKNQLGQNVVDRDQGYSYMGALALSLQQLRYQPPQLETFPTNIAPIWYTSNVVGPLTPNQAWVVAQPAEQAPPVSQNWGSWFFSGFVGVAGNALTIQTKSNPQEAPACMTNCPYLPFFPPSTCNCGCGCTQESQAIWWSSEFLTLGNAIFMFNEVFPIQISPIRSKAKLFNRNTRLRITGSSGGGRFRVGIKTARIGVIDTPFTYIVDIGSDGISENQNVGSNLPIDVNLMDAIASASLNDGSELTYEVGGLDALLALSIQTKTGSEFDTTCPAEFTATGRICPNCLGNPCTFGSSSVTVDTIFIGEDDLAGDPIADYT